MGKHEENDDHHGLAHDLSALADFAARRRAILKWGGLVLGGLPLLACVTETTGDDGGDGAGGNGTGGAGGGNTGGSGGTSGDGNCSTIPEETAGPYPGDGTNGKDALALSGIVRSDIRASIAGASGVAEGVALTVTLTVLDGQNGCKPLAGYAVHLWHCDREGNYSMYSAAVESENYLRGVQETDANGKVTFTTIFPGCYSGRWPHIHFEVFPSLDVASSGQNAVATSQLAFPEAECNVAYATAGYESSVNNLAQISLGTDNVFSDGAALQLATITGSVAAGYAANLNVTI